MSILCNRPHASDGEEALAWLRAHAAPLRSLTGVGEVRLIELEDAAPRWPSLWDFCVEVALDDGVPPDRLVEAPGARELLGDMRLLGMAPSVAVARDERTTALA